MRVEYLDKVTRREKNLYAHKRKENTKSIVSIAVEARKEGLSYGQYVAKYGV